MDKVLIRKAQLSDAKGIAFVHVQSWVETYTGLMPDELLAKSTIEGREKLWNQILAEPKEKVEYWVAENQNNEIVGFVSTCPGRDPTYPGMGEVTGLYLLKKYHGQGLGANLLLKGFEVLKKNGFNSAYLWVLKDSPTESFYKKMNGKRTIEKTQSILGFPIVETFYVWENL